VIAQHFSAGKESEEHFFLTAVGSRAVKRSAYTAASIQLKPHRQKKRRFGTQIYKVKPTHKAPV
jgi:hypothetical protein